MRIYPPQTILPNIADNHHNQSKPHTNQADTFEYQQSEKSQLIKQLFPITTFTGQYGLTIESQKQLNELPVTAIMNGSLFIKGPDITDLSVLSKLRIMHGTLMILDTNIENFNALDNLEQVNLLTFRNNPKCGGNFGFPKLTHMDILEVSDLHTERVTGFDHVASGISINFRNCTMTDMAGFNAYTSLKYMSIAQSTFVGCISGFSHLQDFEQINISDNNEIDINFKNLLASIKQLQKITVYNNKVYASPENLEQLCKFHLEKLYIDKCPTIPEPLIQRLRLQYLPK